MIRRLNLLNSLRKSNGFSFASTSAKKSKQTPIITCKNAKLNLYLEDSVKEVNEDNLASKGWQHYKSKGDHFTIHPRRNVIESGFKDAINIEDLTIDQQLIQNASTKHNINKITSLQKKVIDKALEKKHVLIAAETGCGKTHAFLLPILHQIIELKKNYNDRQFNTPLALILTPGRELAEQIGQFATDLSENLDINIKVVTGGNTKKQVLNPSFDDIDILVGSIGAISKLTTSGIYRLTEVKHVVLDEADTLLDDSFNEKIVYFLQRFKFYDDVQLILASATMPTNTEEAFRDIINTNTINSIASPDLHKILPYVTQKFVRMNKMDRPEVLLRIVKDDLAKRRPVIVFSNKSASSDFMSIFLNNHGVNCININGDMQMKFREGKFKEFQDGQVHVMSTTDCIGRGLNTTRARHIVNFEFPFQIADYIHRCGRIGRFGSDENCLITNFISGRADLDLVRKIEMSARTDFLLHNVDANVSRIINQKLERELERHEQAEIKQLSGTL